MEINMNRLRKKIIEAAYQSREGHIPSALSILDILWVVYDKLLRNNPLDPDCDERDRFILSKGHASLGLYAVLQEKGFLTASDFASFGKYNSILGGHPDRNKIPGVETSTGSLGHGLPMAVGMALGLKIKRSQNNVIALIGDGEANEGTIWESALLAAHHQLDNLCCVVDYNHSTDRALMMGNLCDKFKSFGWYAMEIDGHSHEEICGALTGKTAGCPTAVIAHTIKGKGVGMMENNPAWHHRVPTVDELHSMLEELS